MLRHGFHSPEAQHRGSIQIAHSVHPQGRTPECASTSSVAPQARVKDTRAALIAQVGEGTFIYPGARFAPTEEELEAQRERARSLAYDEGEEADNGDGEDGGDRDSAEDDAGLADLGTSLDHSGVAEDRAAA
jgi:hypothetical protein